MFELFSHPRFPQELRLMVWEFACYCDPQAVTMRISGKRFEYTQIPKPSPLFLACKDAREAALKHYTLIEADTLDRSPPDFSKMYGPWPASGRPQVPAVVPTLNFPPQTHISWGGAHDISHEIRPRRKTPLFYTSFAVDSYILEIDEFTTYFPTFRLDGEEYTSAEYSEWRTGMRLVNRAPPGQVHGHYRSFPEGSFIPPIFGNIRNLVLPVSVHSTRAEFGDWDFKIWKRQAAYRFINDHVKSTISQFRRLESLDFLIVREVPEQQTICTVPFDGEQSLRDMETVAIEGRSNGTSMSRLELRALAVELRGMLWKDYGSEKVGTVDFLVKLPKDFMSSRID